MLSACGGSDQTSAEEPKLPRALASELADMSVAIADALDAGDVCGAAGLADELVNAVEAAIAAGDVPQEFRGELTETAVELQNGVNCEPPPEEGNEEDDEGGENGKGKKKGQEDKDDGITLETTTEED